MRSTACLVIIALLAIGGCREESSPPPEQAPATSSPAPGDSELMKDHFRRAVAARDAIIRGELGAARDELAALGEQPILPGAPASWKPFTERVAQAARDAANVSAMPALANGVAATAGQCGACHAAHNVALDFGQPPVPPADLDAPRHMARHVWAADRLWEGLVGPSDALWARGAEILRDSPMQPHRFPAGKVVPEDALLAGERAHGLGAEAATTRERDGRTEVYGALIQSCASCHDALGVDIGRPGEGPTPAP